MLAHADETDDVELRNEEDEPVVIDEDLDDFVGRVGREVAEPAILLGEHIAFGIERVVGRPERRALVDVIRGPRDPRVGGRRHESPDVDVLLALFEW